MRDRKLIELMDETAVLCGMSDQMNDDGTKRILSAHLNNAQKFLYEKEDLKRLQYTWTLNCVVGQQYYDYPTLTHAVPEGDGTEMVTDRPNPDKFINVTLIRGTSQYTPLAEGIDPLLYNQQNNNQPWRYELRGQIELWPVPDQTYPIQIQAVAALRRLKDDDDRCTVDGDLMVLLAAGAVKGNVGLQDSSGFGAMASSILRSRNAKKHGLTRYIPSPAVMTDTSVLSPDQIPPVPQPRVTDWSGF